MSLATVLSVIGATSVGVLLSSSQLHPTTAFQCRPTTATIHRRPIIGRDGSDDDHGGGSHTGFNNLGRDRSCRKRTTFVRAVDESSSSFLSSLSSSSSSSLRSTVTDDRSARNYHDRDISTNPPTPPSSNGGDDDGDEIFTTLPRHASHAGVNQIMTETEEIIRGLHEDAVKLKGEYKIKETDRDGGDEEGVGVERVYSNHYVDMGKVDTVGFDYDYTLVTYTTQLLELIYSMALQRLVTTHQYPPSMLTSSLKFEPRFPIRGLAVDRETGWICHLSYTHKVAVAFEGRHKVSRARLDVEYRGKRSLTPSERRRRLKPLNDLFSMAECCLIADVLQFFGDEGMVFCPRNAVEDVLKAIGDTHVSGDFHRIVASEPGRYFEPRPFLEDVLKGMKDGGKKLILVSNSPFWYVDAGMKHVIGEDWMKVWEAVIVSAGKPRFYTEEARPFRMVNKSSGQISFKKITRIEPGEVYAEGCLKELIKCINWDRSLPSLDQTNPNNHPSETPTPMSSSMSLTSSNVLYIGDSLFADLVDAKRDFGWTTAAVVPEVAWEIELQRKAKFTNSQHTVDLLLDALRHIQEVMGNGERGEGDIEVIDSLERMVSSWRERQNTFLGNPFGSIFRAQYQPSLFAHSLRRYCDLYMSNVSDLRHYSPQHRFYPDDARLLSHETERVGAECWDYDGTI